ncbi:hypothetical protein E2C01_028251 [Portunus trituberculatus]|uniref:Uncharacterized protein n=1 Tax=Portunus trituberculatus TaxID=210409 RepID=A0A5B7ENU0_PORTR|nr:hypothetical protein [Portunus trituberculatus]
MASSGAEAASGVTILTAGCPPDPKNRVRVLWRHMKPLSSTLSLAYLDSEHEGVCQARLESPLHLLSAS